MVLQNKTFGHIDRQTGLQTKVYHYSHAQHALGESNQKLQGTERKLEGTERRLEGTERKLEGNERKLEGTERKLEDKCKESKRFMTDALKLVELLRHIFSY